MIALFTANVKNDEVFLALKINFVASPRQKDGGSKLA
jgi:hypothetical protein